jgi:lipopolysaccharide transport system ATP-binding protein
VTGEIYSPDDRTPVVLIGLVRADGTPIYGVASDMDGVAPVRVGSQRFAFSLSFPQLPLLPGKYVVRAHALDPEGVRLFDNVEQAFIVEGATRELGLVRIGHGWNGGAPR